MVFSKRHRAYVIARKKREWRQIDRREGNIRGITLGVKDTRSGGYYRRAYIKDHDRLRTLMIVWVDEHLQNFNLEYVKSDSDLRDIRKGINKLLKDVKVRNAE
jgi:hypothetical protein